MDKPMPVTAQDDEIDLVDLILAVWDGKWLIAAITAIVTAIAGSYLVLKPAQVSVSMPLDPIGIHETDKYLTLNSSPFLEVTAEQLLDATGQVLLQGEVVQLAAKEAFPELEAGEHARIAARFTVTAPGTLIGSGKRIKAQEHWKIAYSGTQPDHFHAILPKAIQLSQEQARNDILKRIDNQIALQRQQQDYKLEDLDLEISRLVSHEQNKQRIRVAYLEEQAILARTLDISKPKIAGSAVSGEHSMVAVVQQDTPFYYRGYVAIEKEIELIKGRKDPAAFIDAIGSLEGRKKQLEGNLPVKRAEAALRASPLVKPAGFVAVNYDLGSASTTTKRKPALILVASVMLGGMLSLMVLFIRNLLRSRQTEAA